MPNFLSPNQYSLSTKVILSSVVFIFFFILIRFSLVIPKTQQDAYNNEIENITRSLFFIKEQMNMAVKSIRMQTFQESNLIKEKIVSQIKDLKNQNIPLKNEELIKSIEQSYLSKYCGYKITTKDFEYKKIKGKDVFEKNDTSILNAWQTHEKKELDTTSLKRKRIYLFYNTKLEKDRLLSLGCHIRALNPNHTSFEENLRVHIQKNLSLMQNTESAKTIILWVNQELVNDDTGPLYEKDEEQRRKRYRLSKLSNTRTLTTGKLSAKEILEARDKKPLEYRLNTEEVVTWIVNLSPSKNDSLYTLIYTINKKDILEKSNSNLFVLLPETLIAIGIAFILLLFVFKKLFKNINTLTQTAIKVNKGSKNIRSNLKGKDDISQLGVAFDSMLDFFENSIKILDSKVEEKTVVIKQSLEEKETLLKEVHHRVKNNLALTITLIELQEDEVTDEKTRKALIDIQERIYTMELLHRKLYESPTLSKIPLKEYISDLVSAISATYYYKNEVFIDYKIEDIELNIEAAMPCGLIINELVTNSFKYAFKENSNPKLEIKIFKRQNQLTIIIKDNGKGLEESFEEISSTTLGLKLINTIVKYQLHGSIEYKYDNGAVFTIKGKLQESNKTDI